MYLARHHSYGSIIYSLRQSYFDVEEDTYLSRTVFDLGERPEEFIHEDQDLFFYFDVELERCVTKHLQRDPTQLLEDLLFDFLSPRIRQHLKNYPSRRNYQSSKLTEDELKSIEREVHTFDLRRLYYLRYGAVDQRHLYKMHKKLCRPLLGKSRDEKEFYFEKQETCLPVNERKEYLFAIFNLHRHFTESFAPFMPGALPQLELEEHFLSDLCTLNYNKLFFTAETTKGKLHFHLRRYLFMFFDYQFTSQTFNNEYIKQFMKDHRQFSWPEKRVEVNDQITNKLFNKSMAQLKDLGNDELTKLYRKEAKRLHPDKGGDAELFIQLTEIYNQLMGKTF